MVTLTEMVIMEMEKTGQNSGAVLEVVSPEFSDGVKQQMREREIKNVS